MENLRIISHQSSVISHQSSYNCLFIFLKVVISGTFALIILSAWCYFYYNHPAHYKDKDGVTDFRHEAGIFYSQGHEGFGYGWTNNEGYKNPVDYVPGMDIEILVMGSSHMEAEQIMPEDSAAYLLGSEYGMKVYSVAINGHDFASCSAGLKAAVRKYKPSKFAVIETATVNFTENTVNDIMHGTVPKQSAHDKGIISVLRRNKYLRLARYQLHLMFLPKYRQEPEKPASRESLSEMLAKLNEDASISGAKLIIAYHPPVSLNKDGTMRINDDPETVSQFSELCTENGIYFIDMAGRFLEEYRKNYTLPYGFRNSSVGKGHMNKEGHRMFADEVYRLIQRIEAES